MARPAQLGNLQANSVKKVSPKIFFGGRRNNKNAEKRNYHGPQQVSAWVSCGLLLGK